MKEKINVFEYAKMITETLRPGILLNTNGEKFNSMVIGWGHLGVLWGIDTFVVYVRQSRYTRALIEKAKEFTISVPLDGKAIPEISRICGTMSGRDIDKADYLTLVEPCVNHTPGVKEYPLTIECEVIYQQDEVLADMTEEVIEHCYPSRDPGDFHTMFVGKILDAYIIKD